jgi:hypothetical protein
VSGTRHVGSFSTQPSSSNVPPVSRRTMSKPMLVGLMSRWMIRLSCRYSTAATKSYAADTRVRQNAPCGSRAFEAAAVVDAAEPPAADVVLDDKNAPPTLPPPRPSPPKLHRRHKVPTRRDTDADADDADDDSPCDLRSCRFRSFHAWRRACRVSHSRSTTRK